MNNIHYFINIGKDGISIFFTFFLSIKYEIFLISSYMASKRNTSDVILKMITHYFFQHFPMLGLVPCTQIQSNVAIDNIYGVKAIF